jgi:hypothetical protein
VGMELWNQEGLEGLSMWHCIFTHLQAIEHRCGNQNVLCSVLVHLHVIHIVFVFSFYTSHLVAHFVFSSCILLTDNLHCNISEQLL